jgi:hypothetical protein
MVHGPHRLPVKSVFPALEKHVGSGARSERVLFSCSDRNTPLSGGRLWVDATKNPKRACYFVWED